MWFTRSSFVKIGEKQGRRRWRARSKSLWHWYKIIPFKIRRRMKNCAGMNTRIRDVSTNNIDCCIPSKGKIFCWRVVGDITNNALRLYRNICVYPIYGTTRLRPNRNLYPHGIRFPLDVIRTFTYSRDHESGTFVSIPIDIKPFVYHFLGFTIHKRTKLLFLQR